MRSSCKLVVLAVCLLLGSGGAFAETAKKDKSKDSSKRKEQGKPGSDSKKDADKNKEPEKLAFPVPVGHDSKGLKLPSFGPDGKLKMLFNIGVANRVSDNDVAMSDLQVQTYDEDGAPEMNMELPVSSFNLATRVLSTDQAVTITRDDFVLTGHAMEFNTETRAGKLTKGVKMIIYNLDTTEPPDSAAPKEPPPPPSAALPKIAFPRTDENQPTIKVTKPKPASSKEAKPS